MILKYRELVANIKASNVDIGDTGIKFYTEDDGTAAIGIAIKHNKTPYDLTTNKMTPQLHLFLQDGSIILNEPLKIISGEKGLIEYQVTEKVIKHVGKVFAKLILQGEPNELGVSDSVHALNFRFEILNSGIEEAIERVIDVKLLSEIFEDFALSHPEFMTGLQRNVYTIQDGYWYLDGVNTNILADVSKFKHTHPISEITDLQNILDGKASQSHVLDTASHVSPTDRKMWDSKISQTSADARYVQQSNAFTQAQADGIYLKKTDQLNLSEYSKTTEADAKYALKSHVHSTSEISDFSVEMAKKADKVHNHDGVYSKVGDSYTKVESDGKYATKAHTHQISDVTNLQSSLDAKASKVEVINTVQNINQLKNLLGTIGGFHKDSNSDNVADGWNKSGSGTAGYSWVNGIQTLSSNYNVEGTYITSPIIYDNPNTCYVAVMDMTSSVTTDRVLHEYIQAHDGSKYISTKFKYNDENKVAISYFKTPATGTFFQVVLLKYNSEINNYDNLRVYEIPQSEYDALATMTPAQIKQKYPYTEPISLSQVDGLETQLNSKAVAGHNHDLTYIKKTDGQAYKLTQDDGTIPITSIVDLNNIDAKITKTGTYYITQVTNAPAGVNTAGMWLDYYIRSDKLYAKMTIRPYNTDDLWSRTKNNGTWGSWTKLNGADLTNYYTKSEVDAKFATGGSGGTTDLSAYSTTAQADAKYATKTHTHAIADVTNLQSTLDGKASTSHTHTIANVTGLQTALDGKLTKSVADGLYAPIGSGSSGTVVVGGNVINANKRWGFVGDGTTDNYQAFKDMLTFVNSPAGQGAEIEWDGTYNGVQAQYRVDRYVTISSIDAAYASGSPTHMIWNAKNIKLKTNGAKFINMPMAGFTKTKAFTAGDGSWHYAKEEPITLFNFENCDGVIADSIFVDGENHKIKYATGFTSRENDNPRWTDNKPLAEGRGHGVVFAGSKNVHIENLKSINQAVDGVAIAFSADYGTMKVEQTTSFNIVNLVATGNGRLGVSGLGCHGGEITNLVAEYNGTNKNADGHYIYFSPAGGIDVEPHHSPIAMDNTSPTSYKVEDWNGSMAIKNARIRYNSGTQIACTSTLLTRSVVFERCVVRPPKNRTGDHQLIQSSLQNCRFIDMDVDGRLSDGALSRVMFYGAGYVSESTGVITGQAANVWSEIKGGKWANIEPWVNTDGNTTYNEIPTGQYGLHNIVFADLVMENVRFTLRTIRRFVFRNVVMNYPSDSAITKLYMWNANMKDVVILNRKSSNITLDLGTGDSQSNFENLRITTGRFDWASGTKKYKTATIGSESLDVYDYTRAMEYMLNNGVTGGTPSNPPSDTTPPNAPTVNTVYSDSSTISGTAEANSTITLTGGFSGTTTANSSGAWSIIASNLTAGQTITVKAKDAAGNTSTGTTVTIQAVPVSDTTKPIINDVGNFTTYLLITVSEPSTVTVTRPNGTSSTINTEIIGSSHIATYIYTSQDTSGTYKFVARDTAGNVSTEYSVNLSGYTQSTPTSTNLLGAMSNTASVKEGWGQRKNLNSKFSLNWNEGHGGLTGTERWVVSTDKISMVNPAYDGTTTGTTNERYIYFKFEGLKASTVYTFATDISYSVTDDLTAFGNVVYGANATPKRITMTFKTDSNGAYGYKWESDTKYGTKADGSTLSPVPDATFINKSNLQIGKTLMFDKMMLNEGSSAQPYVASV